MTTIKFRKTTHTISLFGVEGTNLIKPIEVLKPFARDCNQQNIRTKISHEKKIVQALKLRNCVQVT